jgi:hypothetical protein
MLENRCPATLDLDFRRLEVASTLALARAIGQTTQVVTLTVRTDSCSCVVVWQAIGRNKSVRVLKVHHSHPQPSDLLSLMKSISGNPALWSVLSHTLLRRDDPQAQALKTENGEALSALVAACPSLVHFPYYPELFDEQIVQVSVAPVLGHRRSLLPPRAREPVSGVVGTAAASSGAGADEPAAAALG